MRKTSNMCEAFLMSRESVLMKPIENHNQKYSVVDGCMMNIKAM